jgi:predicted transcriptional regulator
MDAVAQLKTLGLSDKEARCYVALVGLGQATAYRVAQKAKLKIPIVYVVLDELRRKGLVLKVPQAKKQLFSAKAPDELFAVYEEQLRYAKRALPELLAAASGNDRVRVLYFEGTEGMREMLEYRTPELAGKELRVLYGKAGKQPPAMYFEYNKKLHEQESRLRGFMPDHPSLQEFIKLDKKYGWDIRPLPVSDFSADASVEIADGFVRIQLYKSAQGVVVEDKNFARMMGEVFEMLWKAKS